MPATGMAGKELGKPHPSLSPSLSPGCPCRKTGLLVQLPSSPTVKLDHQRVVAFLRVFSSREERSELEARLEGVWGRGEQDCPRTRRGPAEDRGQSQRRKAAACSPLSGY